jgi:hypothetical protein
MHGVFKPTHLDAVRRVVVNGDDSYAGTRRIRLVDVVADRDLGAEVGSVALVLLHCVIDGIRGTIYRRPADTETNVPARNKATTNPHTNVPNAPYDRWPHQRVSPSRLVGERGAMGFGVARQCSRNRCLARWSDWIPYRGRGGSRSSELQERPGHGPHPRFTCPTGGPRLEVRVICAESSPSSSASTTTGSRESPPGGRAHGPEACGLPHDRRTASQPLAPTD